MLQVAICDDMPDIRDQLQTYFMQFSKKNQLAVDVDLYASGGQLLSADFLKYDLMILDVQMGEPNGIETARRIRSAGGNMTIIFFTNYIQYALEGYEVQAFRFLLKPLTYAQFADVAGKALLQTRSQKQDFLNVRHKDGVFHIPIADIVYAETERGHVILHTKKQERIPDPLPMKDVEQSLASHPFFRCHTAFLVNLGMIRRITQQDVILQDDTVLPLSKHRRKEMKEALALYWGDQFI